MIILTWLVGVSQAELVLLLAIRDCQEFINLAACGRVMVDEQVTIAGWIEGRIVDPKEARAAAIGHNKGMRLWTDKCAS